MAGIIAGANTHQKGGQEYEGKLRHRSQYQFGVTAFHQIKQKENADERFEQFFHDAGMTLLDDEVRLIKNHFYLIGRKDPARCKKLISEKERLTPNQLTQHLDKSKPILIIDHQPKELSLLADAGADLILGGHTHNGQLFPGNLLLPLMWENPYGLLKKGNAYSVVTSGAGVWGPNMRLGTKSEICLVKMQFHS